MAILVARARSFAAIRGACSALMMIASANLFLYPTFMTLVQWNEGLHFVAGVVNSVFAAGCVGVFSIRESNLAAASFCG